MELIDYILLGGIALIALGIVVWLIKKKKKGQTGCGCGCSGCPSASACAARRMETKNTDNENV